MPRFHAAFSLGTVLGAASVRCAGRARRTHVRSPAGVVGRRLVVVRLPPGVLPVDERRTRSTTTAAGGLQAWREPRTLLIGLMVLVLAVTEGAPTTGSRGPVDGTRCEDWAGVPSSASS